MARPRQNNKYDPRKSEVLKSRRGSKKIYIALYITEKKLFIAQKSYYNQCL